MAGRRILIAGVGIWIIAIAAVPQAQSEKPLFQTSDRCFACHNTLSTSSGEDISIGFAWRASMMANAARDPYWQAGVRREVTDHASSRGFIENECSQCHMPMANVEAQTAKQIGRAHV